MGGWGAPFRVTATEATTVKNTPEKIDTRLTLRNLRQFRIPKKLTPAVIRHRLQSYAIVSARFPTETKNFTDDDWSEILKIPTEKFVSRKFAPWVNDIRRRITHARAQSVLLDNSAKSVDKIVEKIDSPDDTISLRASQKILEQSGVFLDSETVNTTINLQNVVQIPAPVELEPVKIIDVDIDGNEVVDNTVKPVSNSVDNSNLPLSE